MKFCFFIFLISLTLSAMAQGTPLLENKEPVEPIDNVREEQQALEGKTVNDFDVGPYDYEGKYQYYNRLEEEMKAAKEEKKLQEK